MWHSRHAPSGCLHRGLSLIGSPEPDRFPLRSSYGLFELVSGQSEWRKLEDKISYMSLSNKQSLIGDEAQRLVTFFHTDPFFIHKRRISTENANM